MNLVDVSIGTDPEFFVLENNQAVCPAFFALGGDIDLPLPYGMAYPDGAAVEMTVEHAYSPNTMVARLGDNIRNLQQLLNKPLSVRSNGYVAKSYIDALPTSYGKRASLQILGCDADMRVYPWAQPIKRPDPRVYEYRCIGGHIHIGVGRHVIENMALVHFITAFCDALMGTAGTYLSDDEPSRDRKKLYGKSGTIRLKPYGAIEYRPLPSKALTSNADVAYHMFSLAQKIGWFIPTIADEHSLGMLYDLIGGRDDMYMTSYAIDDHNVAQCRSIQQRIAQRLDDQPNSPGLMPHVEALQAMTLPENFSTEW